LLASGTSSTGARTVPLNGNNKMALKKSISLRNDTRKLPASNSNNSGSSYNSSNSVKKLTTNQPAGSSVNRNVTCTSRKPPYSGGGGGSRKELAPLSPRTISPRSDTDSNSNLNVSGEDNHDPILPI
jgi:hypothetical protein